MSFRSLPLPTLILANNRGDTAIANCWDQCMVRMRVLVLCKPAYSRHYPLGEAHGSLAFLLTGCSYENSFLIFCMSGILLNYNHSLHSWTSALVCTLCHVELESACREEQAEGLQALPRCSRAAPLYLVHAAGFCIRLCTKMTFPCSEAAWLTQQMGNSTGFWCWMCAVSHFIVSVISGAHTGKEQVRWLKK